MTYAVGPPYRTVLRTCFTLPSLHFILCLSLDYQINMHALSCYSTVELSCRSNHADMNPVRLLCVIFLITLVAVEGFFPKSLSITRNIMEGREPTTLRASEASDGSQSRKFCLNVNVFVKPERREDFLKAIAVNSAGTLSNEPLNISYIWGESTTEKNTFHFQEQFKGEEGFIAHTNSPHFAVWKEFADAEDSPFWKPPVVVFFETQ